MRLPKPESSSILGLLKRFRKLEPKVQPDAKLHADLHADQNPKEPA